MALVACHECGTHISDQALACPKCGAKPRKKTTPTKKVASWLLAGLIAFIVFHLLPSEQADTTVSKPESPELAAQAAARAADQNRFRQSMHMLRQIRDSMRDPDSFVVERVTANDDASVICVQYHARNGFNGMNREQVVVDNGKGNKGADAWKKRCTSSMHDMNMAGVSL
jgi:DNA-directed RNA polymerase subunit RPC12/RpoP